VTSDHQEVFGNMERISNTRDLILIHRLCTYSYRSSSSSHIWQIAGDLRKSKTLRNLTNEEILEVAADSSLFKVDEDLIYYDAGDPEEKTDFYMVNAINIIPSLTDLVLPELPITSLGSRGHSVYFMLPGFLHKLDKTDRYALTTLRDESNIYHIVFQSQDSVQQGLVTAKLRFVLNSQRQLYCIVQRLNMIGGDEIDLKQPKVLPCFLSCNWSKYDAARLDESFINSLKSLSWLSKDENRNIEKNIDDLPPLLSDLSLSDEIITV